MSAFERLARAGDRLFDRLRHRAAFEVSDQAANDGDLESLRGHGYALLVTFRRDGSPVPSPVWVAVDDAGRAYVKTAADVGKVKRARRNGRVLVAPCNARGRPTGPAIRATARILPPEEWPHAEAALAAAYGLGRRVSERLLAGTGPAAYLELTSRAGSGAET